MQVGLSGMTWSIWITLTFNAHVRLRVGAHKHFLSCKSWSFCKTYVLPWIVHSHLAWLRLIKYQYDNSTRYYFCVVWNNTAFLRTRGVASCHSPIWAWSPEAQNILRCTVLVTGIKFGLPPSPEFWIGPSKLASLLLRTKKKNHFPSNYSIISYSCKCCWLRWKIHNFFPGTQHLFLPIFFSQDYSWSLIRGTGSMGVVKG